MIGLYYHPSSSQSSSLSDLETALESTPPAFVKNFVLLGDFNIDLLQPDSSSAIELTNITSSFHLSHVVNSPTRETANFEEINSDLEPAISSLDPQVDVSLAWNQFRNTFHSVLSNHIPNKFLTTRKSLPWITYHLQLLLRKWDQAYKKAKRTNSPTDWATYR